LRILCFEAKMNTCSALSYRLLCFQIKYEHLQA